MSCSSVLSLSSLCIYLPWCRNLVQAVTPILFDNLIVFVRDIYQVKKVCNMQEGQHLHLMFYPNKHTANSFTFTKHLFLLLFLNMYTHKFKVFANIVYLVQIIISEVTIRWF